MTLVCTVTGPKAWQVPLERADLDQQSHVRAMVACGPHLCPGIWSADFLLRSWNLGLVGAGCVYTEPREPRATKANNLILCCGLSLPLPLRRCVFDLSVRHEKFPQLLRPGNARGVKSKAHPSPPKIRTPPRSHLFGFRASSSGSRGGAATSPHGVDWNSLARWRLRGVWTALFGDRVACQTSDVSSGPSQTCLVCPPLMEGVLKEK